MQIKFDGFYCSDPIISKDGNASVGEFEVTTYIFLHFYPDGNSLQA